MEQYNTYPVPIEQERLAMAMGFFIPAATPTDVQRMEAARMVEGWVVFKRTAYWMYLQQIVERDLRKRQNSRPEGQTALRMGKYTTKGKKSRQRAKNNRSRQHYTTTRGAEPATL